MRGVRQPPAPECPRRNRPPGTLNGTHRVRVRVSVRPVYDGMVLRPPFGRVTSADRPRSVPEEAGQRTVEQARLWRLVAVG